MDPFFRAKITYENGATKTIEGNAFNMFEFLSKLTKKGGLTNLEGNVRWNELTIRIDRSRVVVENETLELEWGA